MLELDRYNCQDARQLNDGTNPSLETQNLEAVVKEAQATGIKEFFEKQDKKRTKRRKRRLKRKKRRKLMNLDAGIASQNAGNFGNQGKIVGLFQRQIEQHLAEEQGNLTPNTDTRSLIQSPSETQRNFIMGEENQRGVGSTTILNSGTATREGKQARELNNSNEQLLQENTPALSHASDPNQLNTEIDQQERDHEDQLNLREQTLDQRSNKLDAKKTHIQDEQTHIDHEMHAVHLEEQKDSKVKKQLMAEENQMSAIKKAELEREGMFNQDISNKENYLKMQNEQLTAKQGELKLKLGQLQNKLGDIHKTQTEFEAKMIHVKQQQEMLDQEKTLAQKYRAEAQHSKHISEEELQTIKHEQGSLDGEKKDLADRVEEVKDMKHEVQGLKAAYQVAFHKVVVHENQLKTREQMLQVAENAVSGQKLDLSGKLKEFKAEFGILKSREDTVALREGDLVRREDIAVLATVSHDKALKAMKKDKRKLVESTPVPVVNNAMIPNGMGMGLPPNQMINLARMERSDNAVNAPLPMNLAGNPFLGAGRQMRPPMPGAMMQRQPFPGMPNAPQMGHMPFRPMGNMGPMGPMRNMGSRGPMGPMGNMGQMGAMGHMPPLEHRSEPMPIHGRRFNGEPFSHPTLKDGNPPLSAYKGMPMPNFGGGKKSAKAGLFDRKQVNPIKGRPFSAFRPSHSLTKMMDDPKRMKHGRPSFLDSKYMKTKNFFKNEKLLI